MISQRSQRVLANSDAHMISTAPMNGPHQGSHTADEHHHHDVARGFEMHVVDVCEIDVHAVEASGQPHEQTAQNEHRHLVEPDVVAHGLGPEFRFHGCP